MLNQKKHKPLIWFFFIIFLPIFLTGCHPKRSQVAASINACGNVNNKQPFLFVLQKGQAIFPSLYACLKNAKVYGAALSGIGAVKNVDIAYFDLAQKKYVRKEFNAADYELLNLNGNVSLKDGEAIAHIHVVLADHNYNAFGGHLFAAKVAVIAEILVTPLADIPVRLMDEKTGTGLAVIQKAKQ